MPPPLVAGDERWVTRPLDLNQGDQIDLLRSAGGGVWSCLYPDFTLRLVRTTTLRARVSRESLAGIQYAQPPAPIVITEALLAGLAPSLDHAGTSWNAGNIELEICSADVRAIVLGPAGTAAPWPFLGGPAVGAPRGVANTSQSFSTANGMVRKCPSAVWDATLPFGNRPTRIAALGLALFAICSSGNTIAAKIGIVTFLTSASTSLQTAFAKLQEWGVALPGWAEEATKDIGSFTSAVSEIPGWCWAGLLL